MIKCEDVIKTNCISKYYDFVFVMYLAAECGRRNEVLDTSNMIIKDDYACLPLRYFVEKVLGQKINWNGTDNTIVVE